MIPSRVVFSLEPMCARRDLYHLLPDVHDAIINPISVRRGFRANEVSFFALPCARSPMAHSSRRRRRRRPAIFREKRETRLFESSTLNIHRRVPLLSRLVNKRGPLCISIFFTFARTACARGPSSRLDEIPSSARFPFSQTVAPRARRNITATLVVVVVVVGENSERARARFRKIERQKFRRRLCAVTRNHSGERRTERGREKRGKVFSWHLSLYQRLHLSRSASVPARFT